MSHTHLLNDMLLDASHETTHQRELVHHYRQQLIRAESQRKSLLFHLRQAARTLSENDFPQTAQLHLDAAASLEKVYEESKEPVPVRPVRKVARLEGSVPGHSRPEASSQAQTPVGVPQTVTWEGITVPAIARRQAD